MLHHEKLKVYQATLEFLEWTNGVFEKIPERNAIGKQLDRASTSILLNIAEGNGKYTEKDRCRFFDIAKGSALECSACLDAFVARGFLEQDEVRLGKEKLEEIVNMLFGLIKSNSDRVYEDAADYGRRDEGSGSS